MAYAYVGGVISSSSTVVTYTMASINNLLVIWVSSSAGNGNPYITSATTNNGSNLTPVYGTVNNANCVQSLNGGTDFGSAWYYKPGQDASAPTSFTFAFNGGTPGIVELFAVEYSGIASTTPLIATVGNINVQNPPGNATDAVTSNSQSVTVSGGALILGLCTQESSGTGGFNIVAGTGYTLRSPVNVNNCYAEDKRVTSTGTYTATFTDNQTSDFTLTLLLAFNESGGTNLTLTPSVGSVSESGVAPGVTPGIVTPITPVTARRCKSGLIVCERQTKIFLPLSKAA